MIIYYLIHRQGVLRITTTGQGDSHQIVRVHHPAACAGGRIVHTSTTNPTGPSAPRRTLVLQCNPDTLMAFRRSIDPNMPPSYDQAVSGRDRSVKVEDDSGTADLPPPPEYSPQADPATAPTLPAEDEERIPVGMNEEVQPLLP